MDPSATGLRARLTDVAARAGVSNSTVSLVMNDSGPVATATRERVLAAAEELGYAGPDPRARSLRRGRSGIVGVVLDDALSDSFRDPMNLTMLDGMAEAFGDAGLSLLIIPGASDDPSRIAAAPLDAAVLFGCSTELDATLSILLNRRVPVIAIEAPHLEGVIAIDLDNREASGRLATYLRELGHERVAMVTLPLETGREIAPLTAERVSETSVLTARDRVLGVQDVFPDAGGVTSGGNTVSAGLVAGTWLLDVSADERPTAILAQSDLLAVGVLRAAEQLGIQVPDQLSVVGFDGIRLDGATTHVLTTMVQQGLEKGIATGEAVLAALAGEHVEPRLFTSELRIGTTSGPVPARPADYSSADG